MVGFGIANHFKMKKVTWSASELFITLMPPKIISLKLSLSKETYYYYFFYNLVHLS